jgi:hypothetical protein
MYVGATSGLGKDVPSRETLTNSIQGGGTGAVSLVGPVVTVALIGTVFVTQLVGPAGHAQFPPDQGEGGVDAVTGGL